MKMYKKCIFHVPNYIDINRKSGSNIRPLKMIEAFKNIGYDVDIVMGYGEKRKKQIQQIKNNIKNGIKYDFLYSESSTMPTLLTEKNHIPRYPFLDFGFFKFCKENNIKIGLFYRDIHWKFDLYKKAVPFSKRMISIPMYKYDIKKYKKYLDILYLPSKRVEKYIPKFENVRMLPPGATYSNKVKNKVEHLKENSKNGKLNIFYVGGMNEDIYYFKELLEVVSQKENIYLTICCREKEWEDNKDEYKEYLNERIKIVHESGKGLEKYYKEADLCSLFLKPTEYMSMAAPIKLFEYLANVTPIIAIEDTVAGEFVKENDCGWTIKYEKKELNKLLDYILKNKNKLYLKANKMIGILKQNDWNERARQVSSELKSENINKCNS